MYNIYTHEKKLKQEKEEIKRKKMEESLEENRRSNLEFILFSKRIFRSYMIHTKKELKNLSTK